MRISEPSDDLIAMWSGISVFATESQARAKHRRFPSLGRYLAEVEIDDEIVVSRQTGFDRGHDTIWGDPEEIKGGVKIRTAIAGVG